MSFISADGRLSPSLRLADGRQSPSLRLADEFAASRAATTVAESVTDIDGTETGGPEPGPAEATDDNVDYEVSSIYVILRVKQKRRLKLILEVWYSHAARLRGKLYFTTTTTFNGVGRAALQAFTAHQYSKSRQTALNDDLRVAIQFFIQLLHCLPPANFHLVDDGLPPLYVWTDAMWEPLETDTGGLVEAMDDDGNVFYITKACIAFTVFDPVTRV